MQFSVLIYPTMIEHKLNFTEWGDQTQNHMVGECVVACPARILLESHHAKSMAIRFAYLISPSS